MDYVPALAELARDHMDISAIRDIAQQTEVRVAGDDSPATRHDITIGIARDPAFCFYYADLIDSLKRHANLVFFSPLTDDLPHADGIYFGGGYPELYAEELSSRGRIRRQINAAAADGVPIYGECGGMIYLCESLIDIEGKSHPMAGVLPAETEMTQRLQALGYTDASVSDNPVVSAGRIRGHEFHYSKTECAPDVRFAYRLDRGKFVESCREYAQRNSKSVL
jgi:cobyrinic acid a,c-diamide synthase